ncbi:F-box/kelch-repeat protein At3g06240-like [Daucus carota subsp. sativus]|uniref:F-box/kelch-repeat protein At3g06240-like n=1 Tax=Daucus carota subsp. sativus TaxID=79200 RepID=UPI0007F01C49|nr:PREDICTED: F-box/kelch-repeat protein At3g06240-like [Daucus carota subsp. sativus]
MGMGGTPKRKKTTAADLPEELIRREILTRLPVRSLVRFKSVSKSWLSLFSEPRFINQHLTHSTTQNHNDCLVATRNTKVVILSRYEEIVALDSAHILDVVGSVRGLVCLTGRNMLSLWNPATHQSKETFAEARFADRAYDIGFGFDPVSDNYKLVILSEDLRFAMVYHSNSDNWIEISAPDNVFDNIRGAYSTSSVTIVKDCPYWAFCRYTKDRHMMATAVKFDAGRNEFKLLPEFVCEHRVRGSKFVDMNDCLTSVVYVYDNDPFSKRMLSLFSLDGDEGCCVWSKMYTIGPFNGWFVVVQGFSGGEIVFDDRGKFCCYDRKTDKINYMLLNTSSATTSDWRISCFRYTPSLAFIQGMKSVFYSTTRTRRASVQYSRVPQGLYNGLKY